MSQLLTLGEEAAVQLILLFRQALALDFQQSNLLPQGLLSFLLCQVLALFQSQLLIPQPLPFLTDFFEALLLPHKRGFLALFQGALYLLPLAGPFRFALPALFLELLKLKLSPELNLLFQSLLLPPLGFNLTCPGFKPEPFFLKLEALLFRPLCPVPLLFGEFFPSLSQCITLFIQHGTGGLDDLLLLQAFCLGFQALPLQFQLLALDFIVGGNAPGMASPGAASPASRSTMTARLTGAQATVGRKRRLASRLRPCDWSRWHGRPGIVERTILTPRHGRGLQRSITRHQEIFLRLRRRLENDRRRQPFRPAQAPQNVSTSSIPFFCGKWRDHKRLQQVIGLRPKPGNRDKTATPGATLTTARPTQQPISQMNKSTHQRSWPPSGGIRERTR